MARTYLGAVVEMVQREIASRFHRDVVLELETGPATSDQLARITEELRTEFPRLMWFAAGGDAERVRRRWRRTLRHRTPTARGTRLLRQVPRPNPVRQGLVPARAVSQL